jgi:tRNA(Ile)-lysidine synthase
LILIIYSFSVVNDGLDKVLQKVQDFIGQHQLLSKDRVNIVALSGGADSVALLRVLLKLGYPVEAAHCNFLLRGNESQRDEDFVKELCSGLDVSLHIIHFDTRTYASLHQVSIEMAARELRYRYFEQLRHDLNAENICVAHHADDAVETLLMNLLRGSGIHGLTGIRPRRDHVVRPLLGVTRREIVAFLEDIGQAYVTDSTNLVADVLRNKIRLQLLPALREVNPRADEHIRQTARLLAEVEKVYNSAMDSAVSRVMPSSNVISVEALKSEVSSESVLFEILSPLGFSPDSIGRIARSVGLAALDNPSSQGRDARGRMFSSPTHDLVIDRGRIIWEEHREPMKPFVIPEAGNYRVGEKRLSVTVSATVDIIKDPSVACLDAGTLSFPLTLRPVGVGDRFVPLGMNGSRLVSDFLTDRKLNLLEKRRQLVLTDAKGTIVWLVGQRTDNRFRVTAATRQMLIISFGEAPLW